MWEWSFHTPNAPAPTTSLLAAYDDLVKSHNLAAEIPQEAAVSATIPPLPPLNDIEEMRIAVNNEIVRFNLKHIRLDFHDYEPQTWQEMNKSFEEYQYMRKAFLRLLGFRHEQECYDAGLSEADILRLREGFVPENYNTHLKIPFDFGGNLEFSNFSLIRTHPHHNSIHRIIDMQIENAFLLKHRRVFIPWFEGKIYHD